MDTTPYTPQDLGRLTDCVCACVTYCSKRCTNADKSHTEYCDTLRDIAFHYSMWYDKDTPTDLREDTLCKKFKPAFKYMAVMPLLWGVTLSFMEKLKHENEFGLRVQYYMAVERLSCNLDLQRQDVPIHR